MSHITLSEIVETLSLLTHVSEESIIAFSTYIDKHGLDETASHMFQGLLKEEEEERVREIEALESMVADIDSEIAHIEPGAIQEMKQVEKDMLDQYEKIESEFTGAYNAVVQWVNDDIHLEQKSEDDKKIEAIKKSMMSES